MAKKIIIAILSVVLVGALAFLITWGVINFNKVQKGLEGTALYTKEDVDSAYRDGYDTALSDKATIEKQIAELRVELTEKQSQLDELTLTVGQLNSENSELSEEVKNLKKEVENLNITIDSYEEFVKEVEESNKVIATFMIDGAVYKIQSYNPGDTISIETPEDTEDYKFNNWILNGEVVDINSYVINESITFNADITYIYTTTFYVNNEVYQTILVEQGKSFTGPENPVAEYGYKFSGWSLDGEKIVPVQTFPAHNQEYFAIFEVVLVEVKLTKCNPSSLFPEYNVEIISGAEYILDLNDYVLFDGNRAQIIKNSKFIPNNIAISSFSNEPVYMKMHLINVSIFPDAYPE